MKPVHWREKKEMGFHLIGGGQKSKRVLGERNK